LAGLQNVALKHCEGSFLAPIRFSFPLYLDMSRAEYMSDGQSGYPEVLIKQLPEAQVAFKGARVWIMQSEKRS
jgi:hypothetical protein